VGLVDEASALNLEGIEKFIGQKIPVEWAEDDLFVAEIRPSAEERRRYAEERRARLNARRGSDRGGPRGGGGSGRDHGRAAAGPVQHAPSADGERRRRRRGRGGGGGGPRPEGGNA